jgi:hypothetical protein
MRDKASVELTFRLPVDLCCKSDEPSTGEGSGIEEAPKDGKSYATSTFFIPCTLCDTILG